ncbi:protein-tyrosine phosphatase-like protein [Lentinula edodes]|uniref:Protein-tyrosine phosphatase-like protein n=1 Tax=Lentinula lateritia TaxID=40482 RepID=A0A9W9ASZ7_9AGAR|nr:protein-tyrosine phosphatase-like protein [Lentinula edodes]
MRQLSLLRPHLHSTATRYYARVSMPLKAKARSSLSNYDLEDLLPRWLQTAYTTSHIQSALTTLDEREDARVHFRAESIEVRSKNANQHLSVDAVQPGGAGKIKAKSKAAAEAVSSYLHSSDSTFDSSESINFYSIASGTLPVNRQRNRYMDVLPYDRTRVKIKVPHFGNPGSVHDHLSGDDESEGLYLNANWVQEKYGRKWWIASQAPLRNTAYTFLSLLLEDMFPPSLSPSVASTSSNPSVLAPKSRINESHHSRPRTVVQLTQNVESGRRKAHPYFPDVVGQTMIIVPDITDYPPSSPTSTSASQLSSSKLKVTLVAQEEIREACCVKSIVEVRPFLDAAVDDEDSDRDSDDLPLRPPSSSSSVPPIPSSSIADNDSDSDHYGDSYDSSTSSSVHRKPKSTRSKTYPAIRFTHLLFVAWPDHSVPSPSDRAALFEFVRLVDRVNRQMPFDDSDSGSSQTTPIRPGETSSKDAKDKMKITSKEFKAVSHNRTGGSAEEKDVDVDPPIIVGCSAGIGRTGSFIAMNSLLRHAGFLPPPGDLQHPSSPFSPPFPSPHPRPPPTQSSQATSLPTTSSQSFTAPTSTTTPPLDASTASYNSHIPVVGPLGPLPTSLSTDLVSQEIDSLREQRAGMVQRPEQAVLVYEMMVGAYVERGELKR